jgi:sec-independent protein translocase protein TatA
MPVGPWELVIILAIVVVIFGAGRLSEIGGAFGKSVREFRNATRDEPPPPPAQATPTQPVGTVAETPCPSCGALNRPQQTYCGQCGTRLAVPADLKN